MPANMQSKYTDLNTDNILPVSRNFKINLDNCVNFRKMIIDQKFEDNFSENDLNGYKEQIIQAFHQGSKNGLEVLGKLVCDDKLNNENLLKICSVMDYSFRSLYYNYLDENESLNINNASRALIKELIYAYLASEERFEKLKQADIIITDLPFSNIRNEFSILKQLEVYNLSLIKEIYIGCAGFHQSKDECSELHQNVNMQTFLSVALGGTNEDIVFFDMFKPENWNDIKKLCNTGIMNLEKIIDHSSHNFCDVSGYIEHKKECIDLNQECHHHGDQTTLNFYGRPLSEVKSGVKNLLDFCQKYLGNNPENGLYHQRPNYKFTNEEMEFLQNEIVKFESEQEQQLLFDGCIFSNEDIAMLSGNAPEYI